MPEPVKELCEKEVHRALCSFFSSSVTSGLSSLFPTFSGAFSLWTRTVLLRRAALPLSFSVLLSVLHLCPSSTLDTRRGNDLCARLYVHCFSIALPSTSQTTSKGSFSRYLAWLEMPTARPGAQKSRERHAFVLHQGWPVSLIDGCLSQPALYTPCFFFFYLVDAVLPGACELACIARSDDASTSVSCV